MFFWEKAIKSGPLIIQCYVIVLCATCYIVWMTVKTDPCEIGHSVESQKCIAKSVR